MKSFLVFLWVVLYGVLCFAGGTFSSAQKVTVEKSAPSPNANCLGCHREHENPVPDWAPATFLMGGERRLSKGKLFQLANDHWCVLEHIARITYYPSDHKWKENPVLNTDASLIIRFTDGDTQCLYFETDEKAQKYADHLGSLINGRQAAGGKP